MEIDGGTGQSESNGSMLRSSIQCATRFRNLGLKTGDVIVLMAPHHLDQALPFYAALYLGMATSAIDRTFGISPVELEDVIHQHPGVLDVAVTDLPDAERGELPVACVVPRPGSDVTEGEIKDLVKEKLADSKQLRGGVIFLKELPLTHTTKVHRQKLKEIALARLK